MSEAVIIRRVLLVEDSDRDAELTLDALSGAGLINEIERVRDGVEALEYLQRRGRFAARDGETPSLVLLDLKMPRMDGLEVLRSIRSDPDLALVPVVVMTSSREEQDLLRSYQLGANAYVVKPVDVAGFAKAVRETGVFWAMVNQPPPSGTQSRSRSA